MNFGNIQLPVIGNLRIAGHTVEKVNELIHQLTKEYLLDAIAVASYKTDYGERKVHIGRKTYTGRQFARIDISDRQAIKSGFYLLQPNDMIYVKPMLAKRFALAQFPYAAFFTTISTAILIINFIN